MPPGRAIRRHLLIFLAPLAGPLGAADAPETLAVRNVAGGACIGALSGPERCFELLEAGAGLRTAVATDEGWVAAGTLAAGRYRDLLLLAERGGEIELLPPPPAGSGGPRGGPALLAADGKLAGLAWLEGTHAAGYSVWASAWVGGRWRPAEEIAPPASRIALRGALLADGRWLLTWTEFDGEDDETFFTVGWPGRFGPPRLVAADNDVPDILPALVASGDGALLAWSRFDGRDYRLRLARWEGLAWRELAPPPGLGATAAAFHTSAGRTWLLYSSVEPEGWQVVELDPAGSIVIRSSFLGPIGHPPPRLILVDAQPQLDLRPPPGRSSRPPPTAEESPTGSTFRYLAFGDSITQGKCDDGDDNCVGVDDCNTEACGLGPNCGYPQRLPTGSYLDCAGNDCEVVNKGYGCETTVEGVSRIDDLLDDQGPWDVVLLMEGTNDVCWEGISLPTIESSLGEMRDIAADRGVETLHASIIHIDEDAIVCPEDPDPEGTISDLRDLIRDNLANVDDLGHRWWADPWTDLCPGDSCFDQHYADWGHPDHSGNDLLADEFRDAIEGSPVPGPPEPTQPIGTTSDTSPTFKWDKEIPRYATWYQFQLDGPEGNTLHDAWYAEDELCGDWVCTLNLGTFPDGTYEWRVRGRNPHGRSAWVETTFTIETLVPPGLPTLVAPSGFIGEDRPTFVWERESPPTATSYELEIRDDGGVFYDQSFSVVAVCAGTTCQVSPFALGDPLAPGDYSWRVRGSNEAGNGPWTALLQFTIIPGLIFIDGFESGSFAAWDEVVP